MVPCLMVRDFIVTVLNITSCFASSSILRPNCGLRPPTMSATYLMNASSSGRSYQAQFSRQWNLKLQRESFERKI